MNGCDSGYQGQNCTEGNSVVFFRKILFITTTYYKKNNVCHFLVECQDNFFGRNCEHICNVTCRSCNKTTGVCDNGCYPGWTGQYCQNGDNLFIIEDVFLKATVIITTFKKKQNSLHIKNINFNNEYWDFW